MPATFNHTNKFDIQLGEAVKNEKRLAEVLENAKIELKSETWQWEVTGNICIEYESYGKPSGIASTQADFWVHELKRDGETLMYLFLPVERLRMLCREAYKAGRIRVHAGDDKAQKVVLLRISELLSNANS